MSTLTRNPAALPFLCLLLLALPASAQVPPQAKPDPKKPSTEEKIRSSLVLCVKVGAEPEGRKICAKALVTAKELAKKKNLAAQGKSAEQVEEFMASLDKSSGTKTAAALETEFDALAKALPVREFKPQYAKYFPPPAPPRAAGQTAAAAKGAAGGPEAKGKLGPEEQRAIKEKAADIARALNQDKAAGSAALAAKPALPFKTYDFTPPDPRQIEAARNSRKNYNMPEILSDVPTMWASYGGIFKKVGADMGVDPYALAAYCIFESYNNITRNFNPGMRDPRPKKCRGDPECERRDRIVGAGIAATQVKDYAGRKLDGMEEAFPRDTQQTAALLRKNPEYSVRCLADEFREKYKKSGDLARTFPMVAYPAWKDPDYEPGNYGTKPEYVSRAYVLYQAFRAADEKSALPATQFATKGAGGN